MKIWAVSLISLVALSASVAGQTYADVPSDIYSKPQNLVHVEGERRLNVYCEGYGSPVILMDAGLGGASYVWRRVQTPLAMKTRVCAYDRAGYGFSDASARPSDVINITADLHRLIQSKAIGGQVIYVGHSIAGLYGVRLAADYPKDVAGGVLIDPAVEGQFERATAISPALVKRNVIRSVMQTKRDLQTCLSLAKRDRLTEPKTPAEKACVATDDDLDPLLRQTLARRYAKPAYQAANLSEFTSFMPGYSASIDERQLMNVRPWYGEKPLTILIAGKQSHATGITAEQALRLETIGKQADELLTKSSLNGRLVEVPESGHFIQYDNPDAVVREVTVVLEKVRQKLR